MKFLTALLVMVPVFAQAPVEPAKPADTTADTAQAPAAVENPAPATEPWFTGSIDFGYRFRTNIGGSQETYRSIVDLSAGPRLLGIDFTIQDPKRRLFDRLSVRGSNWGGDPYNTAHVDATKRGIYDFRFDYSNILYFNALPSYANPFAPAGSDQQWFDLYHRNMSFDLTLLPNRRIVPYLSFNRNSGSGTGVSTFVQDGLDAFPVATRFRNATNNYRGGLRFEFNRLHVTLEQGGTTFKDDDSAYDATPTPGDRTTTLQGQTLQLNSLMQAYGIRAHSVYSKALLTANPFSWLNVYGQFLYSQPKTDVNYQDAATGNFVLLNSLLPYSGQMDIATGSANKPHVSGNVGFEIRPFRRLRMTGSWSTDRFHDAAYASLAAVFLTPPTSLSTTTVLPDTQTVNYSRGQADLFWDLTKKITLRGGYRYEWGDATVRGSPQSQIGPFESGQLNRQVALAGINFRPSQKLSANVDYEGASTTHAYFTTSLYNYNRLRARARYQVAASLMVQANFTVLDNQDPVPGLQYDFRSRDNSLSVNWAPNGGKRISLLAEYDRATIRSSINYLFTPFLTPDVSSYNDNAHIATSAIDVKIPAVKGIAAKLTMGGSLAITNGTRPSRFYEPLARLSIPAGKHVYWNTEWRWYGYGEQMFLYQGFRTHLFQTGLRLSR
jgi:hypothetical protein